MKLVNCTGKRRCEAERIADTRQAASSVGALGTLCQSPRAKRRNIDRSLGAMSNTSASRSTICADGRRSSASILRSAMVEQPSCWASCACVSPSTLRRRFSHSPKDSPVIATLSAIHILRLAIELQRGERLGLVKRSAPTASRCFEAGAAHNLYRSLYRSAIPARARLDVEYGYQAKYITRESWSSSNSLRHEGAL